MIDEKEGLFFIRYVNGCFITEKSIDCQEAEAHAIAAGFEYFGPHYAGIPGWYCPMCLEDMY